MEDSKIRDIVSQLRGTYKAVNEDGFVTDRFLYKNFCKYADVLLRRKQNEGKLNDNDNLFQWIDLMPLITVDKIEAECVTIKTGCSYKRTKYKLPDTVSFDNGPIIKLVMSLDTSENVERTTLLKWHQMNRSVNFKYNKTKYYWFNKGYLYFPNVNWSAVTIQLLATRNIESYCKECCDEKIECSYAQDSLAPYPKDIIADAIGMMQRDLTIRAQIPSDTQDNSQNILR
jgi:hypothetical protein